MVARGLLFATSCSRRPMVSVTRRKFSPFAFSTDWLGTFSKDCLLTRSVKNTCKIKIREQRGLWRKE